MFNEMQKMVLDIEVGGKIEHHIKNVPTHCRTFLVMALQLAKSLKQDEEEINDLVEHVYKQSSLEPALLIGDIMIRLAVLSNALNIDMNDAVAKQFNLIVDRGYQPSMKHFFTCESSS